MSNLQRKKQHHLFTVDLLIEASTEKEALQKAATILNHTEVVDYKITSGIKVGQLVQEARATIQQQTQTPPPVKSKAAAPVKSNDDLPHASDGKAGTANSEHQISDLIQHFRDNNTLVRLSILKGKGVRASIPCRILNLDESTGLLSVYHVDEKRVYTIKVTEIEDFGIN